MFSLKNLRIISFLLALVVLFNCLLVGSDSAQAVTVNSEQIPVALTPCIYDDSQVVRVELSGKTSLNGTEYYLFDAYGINNRDKSDLVVSLQYNVCKEVFYNPMGDQVPLAKSVGKEVARQLTLERYRREVNKIGIEKFQQDINEAASQEEHPVWWDEEVWSIKKLGLSVPNNIIVK